jgi:ADP-heptose:LPS heptosyltransferase
MSSPNFRRAVFVRLDRIGDLVLTLPTDESFNITSVDWWIPKGLSFVTEHAQPVRQSHEFGKKLGLVDAWRLARAVRQNAYDLAVIFHAPWWASFAMWVAGVPVRIGVRSQWHSFLFLNRGVRQKRSRAECSELEYNYRLLEEGLGLARGSLPRRSLRLMAKTGRPALAPSGEFYVVHPGMSGSALNWPTERWVELIERLDHPVVITGTASDEGFLAPLRARLVGASRVIWADGKLSGAELIALLAGARAVIAPSTGVLHLAASTGVPTLGIFSNILVQRALRWGPQGKHTAIVEPPDDCAADECMSRISVDQVLAKLAELLR